MISPTIAIILVLFGLSFVQPQKDGKCNVDPGKPTDVGVNFQFPTNGQLGTGFNCEWILTVEEGQRIKLQVESVDFKVDNQPETTCETNYFSITDPDNSNTGLPPKICSMPQTKEYTSTNNNLKINLKTGSQVSGTGFKVKYFLVSATNKKGNCDVVAAPASTGGEILKYPKDGYYQGNLDCQWTLTASAGKHIKLQFVKIDIDPTKAEACDKDYLAIVDQKNSNTGLPEKICKQSQIKEYTSADNSIVVKFISDAKESGTGFEIKYYEVEAASSTGNCDVNPGAPTAEGVTLKFPLQGTLKTNLNCEWTLVAATGKHIKLNFSKVDITNTPDTSCETSYLSVTDPANQNTGLPEKICKTEQTKEYTTMGNNVTLNMKTGETVSGTGIEVKYFLTDGQFGLKSSLWLLGTMIGLIMYRG